MNLKSLLFVPGHSEKFFQSALKTNADCIVLDLEDSVPLDKKKTASDSILRKLKKLKNRYTLIRLNQISSKTMQELRKCKSNNLNGFILSKIESKNDIKKFLGFLKEVFKKKFSKLDLFPLIENTKSIVNVKEIIKSSKMIKGCLFGHEDYLVSLQGDDVINNNSLMYARLKLANYCRAYNIYPIDMAYLNIKNITGCKNFCLESKSLGFSGMIVVYPLQVDIANEMYAPSKNEYDNAKRIVDLSKVKKNSIFLDSKGKYVGPPHLKKALRVISKQKKIIHE
jgi:citrate lyase beta subunit|tara:strand:- start:987 stop:1832 length:846 start_codon:yes stop_codon:yes gene_type:complete